MKKINFNKVVQNLEAERELLNEWILSECQKSIDSDIKTPPEVINAVSERVRVLEKEIGKIQLWMVMS